MNDNISEFKEIEKMNEHKENNKIFATVLILVGVAVLVNSLIDYSLENWWALFMLFPVGAMVMNIWRDYKENGRLSHRSSGTIIPIVILSTIVAIFLFNLSWTIFWPTAIIAFGLSILLGNR